MRWVDWPWIERLMLRSAAGAVITFGVFVFLFFFNPIATYFQDAFWLFIGMVALMMWIWNTFAFIAGRAQGNCLETEK